MKSGFSRTWKIWSDQEKLVRKSLDLYNSLFKIHSSIHVSEGVPPEVIWGIWHWHLVYPR